MTMKLRLSLLVITSHLTYALPMTAGGFVPYFSYTGTMRVGGAVGPMTTPTAGTTQTFYYQLSGVDAACSSGAGTAANSCGIHIHSGMTCTANAGGHYYAGTVTTDPWTTVAYTATADGTTSGTASVDTGGIETDVLGRAMIIHSYDGSRIACSILSTSAEPLVASAFVPYFSYPGSLAVAGTVGPLMTAVTTQSFAWQLSGVDPACSSGAGSAANSCGIHIHSGMTCTADAAGHYYTGAVTADPWTAVAYTAATDGTTSGAVSVDTGSDAVNVIGRAMIIHAHDGSRIACAILAAPTQPRLTAGGFVPYFSYTGTMRVGGAVGPMTTAGTTQTFYYQLSGVDAACSSGAGTAANSCGIHIHSGMTCTANAGGHYYAGTVTTDPWTTVAYTATADGTTSGTASVNTGGLASDVIGRAMIIHAHDGSRIACSILSTGAYAVSPSSVTLAADAFVPYVSYTGSLAVSGIVGPLMHESTMPAFSFSYAFNGADPACSSGAGTAANSCGIHIHSGMTCTANAGGHYYTGTVTTDPWTNVTYTSSADGTTSGTALVDAGATFGEMAGRALIVHDHTGARIACALLAVSEATASAIDEARNAVVNPGLTTGALVAIIVSAVALLCLVCLLVYCCCVNKKPLPPLRTPSSEAKGVTGGVTLEAGAHKITETDKV